MLTFQDQLREDGFELEWPEEFYVMKCESMKGGFHEN